MTKRVAYLSEHFDPNGGCYRWSWFTNSLARGFQTFETEAEALADLFAHGYRLGN